MSAESLAGGETLLGDLLTVGCALSYAMGLVLTEKFSRRVSSGPYAAAQLTMALLLSLGTLAFDEFRFDELAADCGPALLRPLLVGDLVLASELGHRPLHRAARGAHLLARAHLHRDSLACSATKWSARRSRAERSSSSACSSSLAAARAAPTRGRAGGVDVMSVPSREIWLRKPRSEPRDVELTGLGMRVKGTTLHLDPVQPTERSFLSSARAVASPGAKSGAPARQQQVIATTATLALLAHRHGPIEGALPVPYRQRFTLGTLDIELFPAGHVIGSAQARITRADLGASSTPAGCNYSADSAAPGPLTCEPAEVPSARCCCSTRPSATPATASRRVCRLWRWRSSSSRRSRPVRLPSSSPMRSARVRR